MQRRSYPRWSLWALIAGAVLAAGSGAYASQSGASSAVGEIALDDGSSTVRPPNEGVRGDLAQPVNARATEKVSLRAHPGAGDVLAKVSAGQPVTVHKVPGRVDGHLWITAGLLQGWVPASALEPVASGDALPTHPNRHPYGDATPFRAEKATLYTVRACSDGYLRFSTSEVPGGGATLGHVSPGDSFHVTYARRDASDVVWAYGYSDADGEASWGWIRKTCLSK